MQCEAPLVPSTNDVENQHKIIGYASTFKFVAKNDPIPDVAPLEDYGFPSGTHWADWAQPDSIVLIDQPAGQSCAVLGGIMAARMKVLGVKAVVVNGRVRDLSELRSSQLPVCSHPDLSYWPYHIPQRIIFS
jgi:regulator of RNase E activity RraA